MLTKFLGSAAIIGGSVFIGRNISLGLKRREESLNAFHSALVMLESEISFSANSIDRAFENIAGAVKLRGFFEYVAGEIQENGVRKAWSEGITKYKDRLGITDEDAKILLTLGGELGITNRENQIKNIRYVISVLETAEKEAGMRYMSLSGIYRNVSVGAGIAAAILLM